MEGDDKISFIAVLLWAVAANWSAIKRGFYTPGQSAMGGHPPLRFRDVFGIFTFFLLLQLAIVPAGALVLNYIMTGAWELPSGVEHGWINIAAILASAVGIVFFCTVLEPSTSYVISPQGRRKFFSDIALGAVSWLVCFPVVALFSQVFSLILKYFDIGGEIDQVAVRYLKQILSQKALFWSSFWLIIFAVPFIEEALFRGFLQTWLRQKMSRGPAIALTSLIFASFHFSISQGWHNIDLLAALFLLSCYMGLLYDKRGSIWAPAALHMTFNAISEMFIVASEGGFSQ